MPPKTSSAGGPKEAGARGKSKSKKEESDEVYQNPLDDSSFGAAVGALGEVASSFGDAKTAEAFAKTSGQLQTEVAAVNHGRIAAMTFITFAKLLLENGLGFWFLGGSLDSCYEMKDAITGCVGSFEECVGTLVEPAELDACGLRADSN
eukprot:SAG22_NODE_8158_length_678_cov_1.055268_1_plen_148_part_10